MPQNKRLWSIADGGCSGWGYNAVFFLFVFFLFLSACFATAVQQPVPAGIEIRTQAYPETAAIGDPIRFELDVTTPEGYSVEIPEPEQQTGDFFILEFFPGPVVTDSDGSEKKSLLSERKEAESQQHQARIVAAVYKTGTFTFPGIPVYISDDRGRKTELESPPVDIEIQSILTGNDPDLRDLKKQADIPGEIPWLLWTLIAATACLLGAAAWYIRRRYRKTSHEIPLIPAQDPLDLAESELRNLIAGRLPENGRTKKFYVLLSEIVKRILEAAYGIATAERTTIEIMESLHRRSELSLPIPEAIQSILLQCDVVKFAKYIPSKVENDGVVEEAFRILASAREYKVSGDKIGGRE
ncbi:MAG: hypothetical protein JXR49_08455 [Acidobacteria bacterium]|nr:hypothetical protein [Acidobacteriota bacterium]